MLDSFSRMSAAEKLGSRAAYSLMGVSLLSGVRAAPAAAPAWGVLCCWFFRLKMMINITISTT